MTAVCGGPPLATRDAFSVVDCERCGFAHVLPVPSPEELAALYQEDYYSTEKPLYLDSHARDAAWWDIVHGDRLDTLEGCLGRVGRLLDVGAGPGSLLRLAARRGWEPVAVEPSRQAAAHCRSLGVEVIEAALHRELVGRLPPVDAAHLGHVLEHLPDPAASLELVAELMTPGGVIAVTVPNDFNPFQRALRDGEGMADWWVAPPHHLNYFRPGSLRQLLTRTGFEVLEVEGSFPMDLFLLMGERYVGDARLGRSCHERRMAFEASLARAGNNDLKRALYRKLAELDLGRDVTAYARKLPT